MVDATSFILLMDLVGTIAFAVSGAVMAIRKGMDLFGVNILAVVTATGGGMFRDILIGKLPPVMFRDPMYVLISAITANVVFLYFYYISLHHPKVPEHAAKVYEFLLFLFDALGLGAFTVDGVYAGVQTAYSDNLFLLVVLGVMTGVGGGVLRDVLALELPFVLVRHVYASAAVAGAIVMAVMIRLGLNHNLAIFAGFALTLLIRCLARHYRWNLPKIRGSGD